MKEQKLYDTRAYTYQDGKVDVATAAVDLGATATETSQNLHFSERIHYFAFTKLDKDWIIDATHGDHDVGSFYADHTPFFKREKKTGISFSRTISRFPEGTIAIHISPPGGKSNYNEGRIQILINRRECGIPYSECYGIPTPFDQETHINFTHRLAEHSEGKNPRSIEDIRDHIFYITPPQGSNPWDFMSQILPLESVWENIKSGKTIQDTFKRRELAKEAINEVNKKVPTPKTEYEHIRYGAALETAMNSYGFDIQGSDCGRSNNELLGGYIRPGVSPFTSDFVTIASWAPEKIKYNYFEHFGKKEISVNGTRYVKVERCGCCGISISAFIRRGYRCESCKNVYKMVC